MTNFEVITLFKLFCGALGAFLLFLEVFKAQTVEMLKRKIEVLDREGILKQLSLFKTDFEEYNIQQNMAIFKIPREEADTMYQAMVQQPPTTSTSQLVELAKKQMEKNYATVESYFRKTSPKVLYLRRTLLLFGITLILVSAALDLYGALAFSK